MKSIFIFIVLLELIANSEADCPYGFLPWYEGNCYQIVGDSGPSGLKDFESVSAQCQKLGGELASIHSKEENTMIKNMEFTPEHWLVWIGLHCVDASAVWTDGSPVDYLNNITRDCLGNYGVKFQTTGKWYMGYDLAPGICRHKQRNGDRCFEFGKGNTTCVSVRTESHSWGDAELLCRKDGGHLVSIHDGYMNNEIARQIGILPGGTGGFHIGMQTDTSKGVESWSDGSPVDYQNFAKGFPSDAFGHCTAMETTSSHGRWMTTQCDSSRLPYICGKPAPAPMAPSGCPSNPYLAGDNIIIYSPSYPASYGPISCDYFLTVPTGKRVQLNVNDLNMNLCCDKLMLYEGFESTTPITTLSGKPDGRTYTSQGASMKMTYNSTDGTFVRGWKITFTAV